MQIKVSGIKELQGKLNDISRNQLPYAVASALNKTIFQAQADVKSEMLRVFDRPTPYTLKSVVVAMADKKASPVSATIALVEPKEFVYDIVGGRMVVRKDQTRGPAPKHLTPQVFGGSRAFKRFEEKLQSKGILGHDQMVVPARGAWLDWYGNISQGELIKILVDVEAFWVKRNSDKKSRGYYRNFRYFVLRRGGRPIGIAAREIRSNSVQPVLAFVRKASYKPLLNFYSVVERTLYAKLRKNFRAALQYAIKTAR